LQELHEPSIAKALAKANEVAESSQETPSLNEGIIESPKVMETHLDWRPHSWYISKHGACQKIRLNANNCDDREDSTLWSMASSIGEALMAL
jgi:hypothetical protein